MKADLLSVLPEETVIICGISDKVQWLEKIGFIPGTKITLLTKTSSGVTLRIHGIKYAMCRQLAQMVYINRENK